MPKLYLVLGIPVVAAAVVAAAWWYLSTPEPTPVAPPSASFIPKVQFRNVTEKVGINFRHVNGAFGKKLLPETMGGGVAVLDYNNDGFQDILFINSCYWPGHAEANQPAPTLALYRNKGDGTFEDVTEEAGLKISLYGMGVTAGDYDNDGYMDLFITCVGGNRLFHNVSDGKGGRKFVDVTAESGVGGAATWPQTGDIVQYSNPISFPSSATWLDYDGDGKLDLFVCDYLAWSPVSDLEAPANLAEVGRAYAAPKFFAGTQCSLYRNLGGGRFQDVSEEAGIRVVDGKGQAVAKALGVVACDVDGDGWPDLFVANDTARNFFFHNESDGKGGRKFVEMGLKAGVALAADGDARGAMGIDWAQYRVGQSALLIANFAKEPNSLLRKDPDRLMFADVAVAEGVAVPSRSLLKFGAFFFDYDLDGRADLLTCNGHLEPDIASALKDTRYPQPVQLFWNSGEKGRCFELVTEKESGEDLFLPLVGRGCAYGDFTNTGRLDVVLVANNGPARFLRNEGASGNQWIRLVLQGDGEHSNRSAIGARVTVEADGKVQQREVTAARGYLSQSELPLTFGLGKSNKIAKITVHWPGANPGPPTVLENVDADKILPIIQGKQK
jgi:hypothetical protein